MTITCGIDWAEVHHDVALVDHDGKTIARARIDVGASGFSELLTLIADNGGTAEQTPVAIETDKNLIVVALVGAGFTVYPINPRAVARYRERHSQAGGKSDPGDAAVLARCCAPTLTCTGLCQRSANRGWRSKHWHGNTKKRSGR